MTDALREASLVLAPASPRGWFDGRPLTAGDPVEASASCTPHDAARALEATFSGVRGGLTAAVVSYEGTARFAHFDRVTHGLWSAPAGVGPEVPLLADAESDTDEAGYGRAVLAAQERIAAGDVYVVNLTARLTGRPVLSPRDAFGALVSRGRGDMAAYFAGPEGVVGSLASVSPERFVRITRVDELREIEVWPIKGTAPRGEDPRSDRALAAGLAADLKERAEHVMVVDLERNDIGRVSLAGTVRVDPLMEIVPLPYCHQMVSAVRGVLRPDASLAEVLDSVFPCGSVTGAPKISAMRVIEGLESGPRSAYCGALIVAIPGVIDSSVLIRTLEWTAPDRAVWGSGCGITSDSDAGAEWREVLLKRSPVLGSGLEG